MWAPFSLVIFHAPEYIFRTSLSEMAAACIGDVYDITKAGGSA